MLDRGRGGTGLRASGPQQLRFYWGLSHQNRALIIASRKRGPSYRWQILLAERNGHRPDRNLGARSRMATYKTQMTPAPQEQHGIPVPSDSVERQKKQGIPTDGWWVKGQKAGILGGPFLPSEACWKWPNLLLGSPHPSWCCISQPYSRQTGVPPSPSCLPGSSFHLKVCLKAHLDISKVSISML